jgi:hypothetical protein
MRALIFWASPFTGVTCQGHALTCVPLCHEGGRCMHRDFRSEGVRWHGCRHPRCCGGMDVVMGEWLGSCQVWSSFSCSCWLCTVMSITSMGASTVVGGPHGSPSCLRVPRAPRARRKRAAGDPVLFNDAMGAQARWRDVARDAYRA